MAEMEKGFLILGAVEIGNGRWSFPKPNSNQVACQQFSRDGQITFKTVLNNKRKSSVRIFYNHGRRLVEEVDWEGDGIADLMIVFDENGQALDAIERNKKGLMEQMDQEKLMELKKIFSVQSKN